MTRRTRQFQCVYHHEFQTNCIGDFKVHLHSHQKIITSNINERIPVFAETKPIRKDLLLD